MTRTWPAWPARSVVSPERLPATTNSEPNDVTMKNQFDTGTLVAAAPPMARSTNPAAITTRSTTATFLRARL